MALNISTLAKQRVPFIRLQVDPSSNKVVDSEYFGYESRAVRLVKDPKRFLTVSFKYGASQGNIERWLHFNTGAGQSIDIHDEDDGMVRSYVFFGYTESSLNSGQLLFFQEGEDFTVHSLIKHFGDLHTVYEDFGYGRFAARLGLSFSSTVATEEVRLSEIVEISDLLAADESLTSDGNGLIRASYATVIASKLGVSPDTTAFQIRLGGIKGVLTHCPNDIFDRICGSTGKKIAYRRSMLKYRGGPRILEVQDVSRPPKSGRLCKQFIILLLTRGIHFSVFEELLRAQITEIENMSTDRKRALETVDGELDADAAGYYQDLYEMLLAGHDMDEPYLAKRIREFQNDAFVSLRDKLHIPVKKSVYAFGVVDHCGVLEEGQVYINLPSKGGPQVGPVAVIRNPAYDSDGEAALFILKKPSFCIPPYLLAGIRVLEAVNHPALAHLTNCVVFAARGSHSETDRMGGGDLDGDLYFVIFDSLLIPAPRAPVVRSPKKSKATSPRTVTIGGRTQIRVSPSTLGGKKDMREDAIKVFLELRSNFIVGGLYKEWISWVVKTPHLADLPRGKQLAEMLERAHDLVKNGTGSKQLKYDLAILKKQEVEPSAENWEDPLEKLTKLVPTGNTQEMQFRCDPQLVLRTRMCGEQWQKLAEEAFGIMCDFNNLLSAAINADAEAKALRLEQDKTLKTRANTVKEITIAQHFPHTPEDILEDFPKYMLKASVWYFVGYQNRKEAFAWLGARWLNHIKAYRSGHAASIPVGSVSRPLRPTTIADGEEM